MAEVSTIPAYILANENLLMWLLRSPLNKPFSDGKRNYLREFVYVDFHRWNTTRPDHVFLHRWENFVHKYLYQENERLSASCFVQHPGKPCSLMLACMEALTDEYIEFSHGEIHIRMKLFGWWQNMLSRMSALPVQAHAIWRCAESSPAFAENGAESVPAIFHPYDEGVENYIHSKGLNDSHIHVNLIAGGEVCWLNLLRNPEEELSAQRSQFPRNPAIVELYREIHVDLTPEIMHSHAKIAARMRRILVAYAEDACMNLTSQSLQGDAQCAPQSAEECLLQLSNIPPAEWDESTISSLPGVPQLPPERGFLHTIDVLREREWMSKVLQKLSRNHNALIDRTLHIYLLLMNEYYIFCVQRDNFYGFRQFNKYSQMGNSFPGSVLYYEYVFRVLHGPGLHSCTDYAELRIAPKRDSEGTCQRIIKILHGYLGYLYWVENKVPLRSETMDCDVVLRQLNETVQSTHIGRRVVRPAIVIHLIKKEWKFDSSAEDSLRFSEARQIYDENLDSLYAIFKRYPLLRKWVCGIDAAADEMDTPPDTFAPAYRKARVNLGLRHATYHAGEDFYHLIAGLRNICDAVELLGLQRGDRIGHATALGVEPSLWLRTMPGCVTPKRGEWLQDLVFLWGILHQEDTLHDLTRRLDYDIRDLGYAVFRTPGISPYLLLRVYKLRALDPRLLRKMYQDARGEIIRSLADDAQRQREYDSMSQKEREEMLFQWIHKKSLQRRWIDGEHELIQQAFRKEAPEIMRLLLNWYTDKDTICYAEERIEVPTDYLTEDYMVKVQQIVMSHLSERGIVLETLPSSNLRIGQYKEMGQHHSLRWMGVRAHEGDAPPPFVLGSDDPGTFATDIKGEFYHLFASLCKNGLNAQDALERLIGVNKCGYRYAFRSLLGNDNEEGDIFTNKLYQ